ncbi:acyl-CoA carboxylase subunit epsilon [Streptomyces sp. NPDC005574]|uniref:acyl-CoA carboxylase subunit epsilon n=1 Tax=Streptomyces sp. NPDC005574 TaxID=3156891 RepID=UPI0033A566DC
MSGTDGERDALVIRVVRGRATAADIAALTSVLLARAAALTPPDPTPRTRPTAPWRPPPPKNPRPWTT